MENKKRKQSTSEIQIARDGWRTDANQDYFAAKAIVKTYIETHPEFVSADFARSKTYLNYFRIAFILRVAKKSNHKFVTDNLVNFITRTASFLASDAQGKEARESEIEQIVAHRLRKIQELSEVEGCGLTGYEISEIGWLIFGVPTEAQLGHKDTKELISMGLFRRLRPQDGGTRPCRLSGNSGNLVFLPEDVSDELFAAYREVDDDATERSNTAAGNRSRFWQGVLSENSRLKLEIQALKSKQSINNDLVTDTLFDVLSKKELTEEEFARIEKAVNEPLNK